MVEQENFQNEELQHEKLASEALQEISGGMSWAEFKKYAREHKSEVAAWAIVALYTTGQILDWSINDGKATIAVGKALGKGGRAAGRAAKIAGRYTAEGAKIAGHYAAEGAKAAGDFAAKGGKKLWDAGSNLFGSNDGIPYPHDN